MLQFSLLYPSHILAWMKVVKYIFPIQSKLHQRWGKSSM
ncbi:hypothetical protein AM1_1974 [Acaryochloris marina MBIC11017]|uniref:Uncharacterized protein n=1 Tax=Acaryochloris marina (strain MBIC 11017) TaxID=329726 RepID=B0CFH2_ACAM1|nr:hypothetical protein AM1_1974 [Acaryochloris marina MBIC11017]